MLYRLSDILWGYTVIYCVDANIVILIFIIIVLGVNAPLDMKKGIICACECMQEYLSVTLESVLAKKITAASLMSSDSITAVQGVLLFTCLPGDLSLSLSLLLTLFFWDNRGLEVEASSSKTTSGTVGLIF